MCGVRRSEVFTMLEDAKRPVYNLTAIDRFKQVMAAQNLYPHGMGREYAIDQATEFYERSLEEKEWDVVVELAKEYFEIGQHTGNEFLRWLIASLLDVLEESERLESKRNEEIKKRIRKAMDVKLNFSTSKGKSFSEIYEQAENKNQFLVVLKYVSENPKADENVKAASNDLISFMDQI